MSDLIEAQARKAIEQLHALGWAVGRAVAREEWRRAARAEAPTCRAQDQDGGVCGRD